MTTIPVSLEQLKLCTLYILLYKLINIFNKISFILINAANENAMHIEICLFSSPNSSETTGPPGNKHKVNFSFFFFFKLRQKGRLN